MRIECQASVVIAREMDSPSERVVAETVTITLEGTCDAILTLLRDVVGFDIDKLRRWEVK